MNLIIGGDVVPSGHVGDLFEKGDVEQILGTDLFNVWEKADYKFFNLECPITLSDNSIIKCGPNIKSNPNVIDGIKILNPTCIMLSNNHIMDYSIEGAKDTVKLLNSKRIDWIGIGENINNIKKSYIIRTKDMKIAVYNCCEREFSIASEDSYGANPFDYYYIDKDLKLLKEKNDYLIIIYHGGKEYYRYPSPELQKRCRKLVDYGADVVICQHSHCIGCREIYNNSEIVYGQGNFIFTIQDNEYWNSSLLVELEFNNLLKVNYIPIVKTSNGTRLANDIEKNEIMKNFYNRSQEIMDDKFVKTNYQQYAREKLDSYIIWLYGDKFFYKVIRKFFPQIFSKIKFKYASILNILECEAHNELLISAIKTKIQEQKSMEKEQR